MQVKSEGSRVFGSGNWTREHKNGRREGKMYFGLANTKVYQRYSEVLRIGKLLLSIHLRLHIHS